MFGKYDRGPKKMESTETLYVIVELFMITHNHMVSPIVHDGCIPRSVNSNIISYLFGFTTFTFLQNGPKSHIASFVHGPDDENGMNLPLFNFFVYCRKQYYLFFNKCINNFILI
jgi:hypothetical protein